MNFFVLHKTSQFMIFRLEGLHVEHQFSLKIKSVETNWGGEYKKLSTFFQTISIHHRLICPQTISPHTHEQNDTVEYRHMHIVETRLALLRHYKAPLRF